MRHEVGRQIIDEMIGEVEAACGGSLSDAQRADVAQRLGKLLSGAQMRHRPVELKRVSILLSDLRGFTALTERYSAGDVIELLNRYFSRMCEVIFRYGGAIDKFMGDGIMVLFGAPESGQEDLMRAVACAAEMQCVMNEVNEVNRALGMPALYMGIGINTGEVVAASVGSDLHREYTVIGDHVNLASRIEAHSLRGQVLLSEHSYRLAKDFIEVSEMKSVLVKGKRDPVKLYELKATRLPRRIEVPVRESRRSPRVSTNMPFAFQFVDGKAVLPEVHRGQIADISYSGMLVLSDTNVPVNSEIKLSAALSVLDPEVTDIYARILRVAEGSSGFECSVEFTSIDEAGQRAVRQFVDRSVS